MQQCNICSSNPNNKIYNYHVFEPEINHTSKPKSNNLIEGLFTNNDENTDEKKEVVLNGLDSVIKYMTCDVSNQTLSTSLKTAHETKEKELPGIQSAYNRSWTNYHTCNNKRVLCNQIIPTSQQMIQSNINTNTKEITDVNKQITSCESQKQSCYKIYSDIDNERQVELNKSNELSPLIRTSRENQCYIYTANMLSDTTANINRVTAEINQMRNEINGLNRGSFWRRLRNIGRIRGLLSNINVKTDELNKLNAKKNIIDKCQSIQSQISNKNTELKTISSNIKLLQRGFYNCYTNYNKNCPNKNNELLQLNEKQTKEITKLNLKNAEYDERCSEKLDCDTLEQEKNKNKTAYDNANAEILNALNKYNESIDPTKNNCKNLYSEMNRVKQNTNMDLTEGYTAFDESDTMDDVRRKMISNYESIQTDYTKLKANTQELNLMNKNQTMKTSKYAESKIMYDKTIYTNILLTALSTSLLYYLIIEL